MLFVSIEQFTFGFNTLTLISHDFDVYENKEKEYSLRYYHFIFFIVFFLTDININTYYCVCMVMNVHLKVIKAGYVLIKVSLSSLSIFIFSLLLSTFFNAIILCCYET